MTLKKQEKGCCHKYECCSKYSVQRMIVMAAPNLSTFKTNDEERKSII